MEICINDLTKICRTCMQEDINMISIYSSIKDNHVLINIIDMINDCTAIQLPHVAENDPRNNVLPINICTNCLEKLRTSYLFRQQTIEVNSLLNALVKQIDSSDCIENVENDNILLVDKLSSKETKDIVYLKEALYEINENILVRNNLINQEANEANDTIPSKNMDITPIMNMKIEFDNNDIEYLQKEHENVNEECYLKNLNDPDNIIYQCTKCDKNLSDLNMIIEHAETHINECIVCKRKYSCIEKLEKHLLNKHIIRNDMNINKIFNCDICDKSYTTLTNLTIHKVTHTGYKPYLCKECDKSFYKKSSLLTHMSLHTGIRKFLCSECGRRFTSSNILQQHKKTHNNIKPHVCTVCLKGFHSLNDLRVHFRTHSGEKPFLCNICGRGFSRVTHLNIHLRTHSGERPYSCDTCGRAFAQSGDLKAHKRTHTGEKPYKCPTCDKRFNQSSGLASHIKSHTGERNYLCDVCNKRFTQSSSLARHMKSHNIKKD